MFETVVASGLPAYKTISLSMSAEEAVRTATLELLPSSDEIGVFVGQDVSITANGTLLLTGYVRDVNPAHDADNHTLSVFVVSRTVDAVECSADHPTGEILKKSLPDIARELDTHGVGIEADGSLPIEPTHRLRIGDSLFHSIEERARGRGVLIHDTPKGKLKLTAKPEGTHSGGLIFGQNIEHASASFTEKGRFSKVKVRGQSNDGTGKQQLRAQATAADNSVNRTRTLIIRHEGETTVDRMKMRAGWNVKRAAGNATTATITTKGWRDSRGQIWNRNWLVYVRDPAIGIDGLMVIKSVTLNQDADGRGTTATLQLADPRALGGENPRGKSSAAYAAPGATTEEYEEQ